MWDKATRKTRDALKLKIMCVGSCPHLRISYVGLNHARLRCIIGWALAGDVCVWVKGWVKYNSQGLYTLGHASVHHAAKLSG